MQYRNVFMLYIYICFTLVFWVPPSVHVLRIDMLARRRKRRRRYSLSFKMGPLFLTGPQFSQVLYWNCACTHFDRHIHLTACVHTLLLLTYTIILYIQEGGISVHHLRTSCLYMVANDSKYGFGQS